MRTTLTLDDDLVERLKAAAVRDGKPFKVIVNDALRAGLGLRDKPARRGVKFTVRTFRSRLRPGVDETRLNQCVDQLEAESFLAGSAEPGGRA